MLIRFPISQVYHGKRYQLRARADRNTGNPLPSTAPRAHFPERRASVAKLLRRVRLRQRPQAAEWHVAVHPKRGLLHLQLPQADGPVARSLWAAIQVAVWRSSSRGRSCLLDSSHSRDAYHSPALAGCRTRASARRCRRSPHTALRRASAGAMPSPKRSSALPSKTAVFTPVAIARSPHLRLSVDLRCLVRRSALSRTARHGMCDRSAPSFVATLDQAAPVAMTQSQRGECEASGALDTLSRELSVDVVPVGATALLQRSGPSDPLGAEGETPSGAATRLRPACPSWPRW